MKIAIMKIALAQFNDTILKAYIEENLSAGEIAEKYRLEPALVRETIRRVNGAEYKRLLPSR